jgi:hypothetical protein
MPAGAKALELLVGGTAVLGGEEDRACEALRHQVANLLAGLLVHHGSTRDGHQRDGDVGLVGRADGQPAEVGDLGQGDVRADLHADLLGPELERLVLVVDPELCGGDVDGHPVLLGDVFD